MANAAAESSRDPYDQRERGIHDIPLEDLDQNTASANIPSVVFPASIHLSTTNVSRSNSPTMGPPPYSEHTRDPLALPLATGHPVNNNTPNDNIAVPNGEGDESWHRRLIERLRESIFLFQDVNLF